MPIPPRPPMGFIPGPPPIGDAECIPMLFMPLPTLPAPMGLGPGPIPPIGPAGRAPMPPIEGPPIGLMDLLPLFLTASTFDTGFRVSRPRKSAEAAGACIDTVCYESRVRMYSSLCLISGKVDSRILTLLALPSVGFDPIPRRSSESNEAEAVIGALVGAKMSVRGKKEKRMKYYARK